MDRHWNHAGNLTVDRQALSGAAACAPAARLRIHIEPLLAGRKSPWLWLKALCSSWLRREEHLPVRLRIADLDDHEVFSTDRGRPLTVVCLPPATYHVAAARGAVYRRYTMTLEPDTSFDLHVNLVPVPSVSQMD